MSDPEPAPAPGDAAPPFGLPMAKDGDSHPPVVRLLGLSLGANVDASLDTHHELVHAGRSRSAGQAPDDLSSPSALSSILPQAEKGGAVGTSSPRSRTPAASQGLNGASTLSQPLPSEESAPKSLEDEMPTSSLPHPNSEEDITSAMLPASPSKEQSGAHEMLEADKHEPPPKEAALSPPVLSDAAPAPSSPARPRSPFMAFARLLPTSARSSMSAMRSPSPTPRERHQSMPSTIRPPGNANEPLPGQPSRQIDPTHTAQASSFPNGTSSTGNEAARPPPAATRPEEAPFDFNLFLEQMKQPSAAPVGEYVRSFVRNFGRHPRRLNEQVQLIRRFLNFVDEQMAQIPPWSQQNSVELNNAKEGMEKLVMNRLYTFTFAPAVAAAGRWPVQTDDLERDAVLDQKVRLFGWVKETHLDLPLVAQSHGFVTFAVRELLKINQFKAPRDKLICILNVCKVIFGLIRHFKAKDAGADTFLPLLILVVLRAQCPNLVSNVEYIAHFRSPERLSSESGYYLSSLQGAIGFIEQMDFSSLANIPVEEFERQVEAAASKLSAEREQAHPSPPGKKDPVNTSLSTPQPPSSPPPAPKANQHAHPEKRPEPPLSNPQAPQAAVPVQYSDIQPPSKPSETRDNLAFPRNAEVARFGAGGPMDTLRRLWSDSAESGSEAREAPPKEDRPKKATSKETTSKDAVAGEAPSTDGASEESDALRTDSRSQSEVESKSPSKLSQSPLWSRLFADASSARLELPTKWGASSSKQPSSNEVESSKEEGSPVTEGMGEGTGTQETDAVSETATVLKPKAKRKPSPLWAQRASDKVEGSNSSQASLAPVARNRLLSIFSDGPSSSDPASPGPQDLSFAAPDQAGQASSLKLPLPNWALSAMRRKSSGEAGTSPVQPAPSSEEAPEADMAAPPPAMDLPLAPPDEEAAAAWASESDAKAESLARAHEQEQANVATLAGMFPRVDPLVCQLVLENCRGDLEASIEKLLAMD